SSVCQKQRTAKEPFSVSYITKAPYAPDNIGIDPLREGIALEHSTVFEPEDVKTFPIGMIIEFANVRHEAFTIFELIEHECEQLLVVALLGEFSRNSPQGEKPLVMGGHLALAVHNQNAVRCGFDRSLQ